MTVRRSVFFASALCSVLLGGTAFAQDDQARAIAILKVQQVIGPDVIANMDVAVAAAPSLVAAPASLDADVIQERVDVTFGLLLPGEMTAVHVRLPKPRPVSLRDSEILAYAEEAPRPKTRLTRGQSAIAALVEKHAEENEVPLALAHALVKVESNYNPKATGARGEIGLLQINPKTARAMGYKGPSKALYDPETNLEVGMKYLARAHDLADGDTCGTLLRYNAGLDAKRMNKATSRFCSKVKSAMRKRA